MAEPTCPHCGTKITEHDAKPCLSAWVAEAVRGWEVQPNGPEFYALESEDRAHWISNHPSPGQWHPHEDIAAAMEVVEHCGDYDIERCRSNEQGLPYSVVIYVPAWTVGQAWCEGPTLPLAICRAAILASAKEKTK